MSAHGKLVLTPREGDGVLILCGKEKILIKFGTDTRGERVAVLAPKHMRISRVPKTEMKSVEDTIRVSPGNEQRGIVKWK